MCVPNWLPGVEERWSPGSGNGLENRFANAIAPLQAEARVNDLNGNNCQPARSVASWTQSLEHGCPAISAAGGVPWLAP